MSVFSKEDSGLPQERSFLDDATMSIPKNGGVKTSSGGQGFDTRLIASVLAGHPRRKLLLALESGGPQTAGELMHAGKGDGSASDRYNYVQSTVKNLMLMIEAGMVVEQVNPRDGRRTIYSLAPGVKVTREGDLTVFDFGSRVARLDADGN